MTGSAASIETGAMARVTSADPFNEGCYVGLVFRVEDYVTAEEAEDGQAFYWGSTNNGYNDVTVLARCIEQVMTAEQALARRVPTVEEVVKGLSLLGEFDFGEIDETEIDGEPGVINAYGVTPEGLRFSIRFRVTTVQEVDF